MLSYLDEVMQMDKFTKRKIEVNRFGYNREK